MEKKIVCLDAGHSGQYYNQSTEVAGYYESEMAWKLHLYLKDALEARGFTVTVTRENQNDDPEVYNRGIMSAGADLFLSLHSNACGTESVDYPIIYRAYDNWNDADGVALPLAQKIATMMGTTQAGKTGTRTTTSGTEYYGVMRGARAVSCPLYFIIEHSFHTNKSASLWLLEDENLKALAEMEAEYFAEYFGTGTEEDTSSYTKIMGTSQVSIGQMKAYLNAVNPDGIDYLSFPEIYQNEGQIEGVRGDIAFAQALLETGNFKFGGDVKAEQNNFCGLGATGNGEPGCSFETAEYGIRAQIQHLKAYASTETLALNCIDPRFSYVQRGIAEYVEWLGIQENPKGTGWAAGANYGTKILAILDAMEKMEEMAEEKVEEPEEKKEETVEETVPTWMATAVNWMVENGLMMGDGDGNLRVNDPVTRGEFAVMLYSYHQNCK